MVFKPLSQGQGESGMYMKSISTQQLIIQYEMVILENISTSDIVHFKQVVLMCLSVSAWKKEDINLKEQSVVYGWV